MRNRRIIRICAILLATLFAACGCGTAKEDQPGPVPEKICEKGIWEEDTYTNAFFGFEFAKPDVTEVMSDEELEKRFSEGNVIFDPSMLSAEHPFILDTALKDSRHNICFIMLVTEPQKIWGVGMTKEDCAAELLKGLDPETVSEPDTAVLYGEEFVHFISGDPETVYNAYYVGERDGYAVIFICFIYESQNPDMTELMESFTKTAAEALQTEQTADH